MKPYNVIRPILFQLDAERAHRVAMAAISRLPARVLRRLAEPAEGKPREVFGITFPNPVGLAAGFDKNAHALPAWEALGFGFVEAGTITARAQPGNPRPRVFRFPKQEALVNRMGFNNDGADAIAARLAALRNGHWPAIPVGINIGKSKVTPVEEAVGDYLYSFGKLAPLADYIVLNVSSPNTPGLRALQAHDALAELLAAIRHANARFHKPVLLKIAPDLDAAQLEDILLLAVEHGLAGIVATNTTLDHSSLALKKPMDGGLSGRPLRARSTEIVRFITGRCDLPVIAAGGIFDADSAREKFDAGASLVQLYTGFVYRGPDLIAEIIRAAA